MKRSIELKSSDLLMYGSELTEKIQEYINRNQLLLATGKAYTQIFKMSDNRCVFIHHTSKSVIVELPIKIK